MNERFLFIKGIAILFAVVGIFILSGCSATFNTLSPAMTSDANVYSLEQKTLIWGGIGYTVEDTAGWKANYLVSSIDKKSKISDWALSISSTITLELLGDHVGTIRISNDADSAVFTLLYMFKAESDGTVPSDQLGDTVLILRDEARAGYLLPVRHESVKYLPLMKSEDFDIVLDGTSTLVHHEIVKQMQLGDEWYALYRGDTLIASIGNVYRPSVGQLRYHVYVKHGPTTMTKTDAIFSYFALEAYHMFRSWESSVASQIE